MILLLASVTSLVLHILLGWQWSLVGGIVAGTLTPRFGWLTGTIAVTLSWGALVLYNFSVAPAEMTRFLEIVSGLFGNMPRPMVVVTTLAMGALLGLLGGTIGTLVRSLTLSFRSKSGNSTVSFDEPPQEPNP
jgi:hypothetical protein